MRSVLTVLAIVAAVIVLCVLFGFSWFRRLVFSSVTIVLLSGIRELFFFSPTQSVMLPAEVYVLVARQKIRLRAKQVGLCKTVLECADRAST